MASADPPAGVMDRPGYLLKRAQAALHAGMAGALREHGATLAQYAVLTALDEEPGLSNAGLARRAFVTPQTMNQVLLELEQITGRTLPQDLLFESATVPQLAESIVRSDTALAENLLIEIQPGAGRPPFIFVDGDFWGGGYYTRKIAQFLGPEYPFYDLRSHGLRDGRIPPVIEGSSNGTDKCSWMSATTAAPSPRNRRAAGKRSSRPAWSAV